VVELTGSHRERFLHSQVTSDVAGLPVGASQLSALLDRSGRLHGFFFVLKRSDRIQLLVPEEALQGVVEQLEEHIIADDVTVAVHQLPGLQLALGPEAVRFKDRLPDDTVFPIEAFTGRGFVTWSSHELPFEELDQDQLETLRLVSGLPLWGADASAGTLINETTLVDTAVSPTKGCFLGQETVAKVASHRGAAYQTVALLLDGTIDGVDDLIGARFAVGDRTRAGVVHASTRWGDDRVLSASLYRDLRVAGRRIECRFESGATVRARVEPLPLVVPPPPEEHAEQLHLLAVTEFTADRDHDAIQLLERAVVVCPWYADAYESLGVILGRMGRYDEAIRLMERLLELDPDSVMAHTNMSVYYNQLGQIEDAEREARAAAVAAARCRAQGREHADADRRTREQHAAELRRREDMFREILALDPDDALGHFGMGELCVERGQFEDAVLHLEKAIQVDQGYSAAYLALGRAWEGMREQERAREVYEAGVLVAAARGDLATANTMQGRLTALEPRP
jgi:folate-binding protein YgfZ